mmetsp:Transcript_27145/g.59267  ORF Transcript_27145/g.59267 Transcript_27145/m.59267 type:complete len:122 (+) Transcript_27145:1109-1474(+)
MLMLVLVLGQEGRDEFVPSIGAIIAVYDRSCQGCMVVVPMAVVVVEVVGAVVASLVLAGRTSCICLFLEAARFRQRLVIDTVCEHVAVLTVGVTGVLTMHIQQDPLHEKHQEESTNHQHQV